ncbi:MAG: hypothetical protein U0Q18_15245 [Bryobacteraceae bacterium]
MRIRRRDLLLGAVPSALAVPAMRGASLDRAQVCVVAGDGNRRLDVTSVMEELGVRVQSVTAAEAEKADLSQFALVWFAAPSYPYPLELTAPTLEKIEAGLRAGGSVFAEFAVNFPGVPVERTIQKTGIARLYVSSPLNMGPNGLVEGSILDEHDSICLPLRGEALGLRKILSFGRVPGVEKLAGNPKTGDTWPGLVWGERGPGHFAVATTSISEFRKREYAPASHWERFIRELIFALLPPGPRRDLLARHLPCQAYTNPRRWVMPGSAYEIVVETRPGVQVRTSSGGVMRETAPGRYEASLTAPGPGNSRIGGEISAGDTKRAFTLDVPVADRRSAYRRALERNIRWFEKSGVLFKPDGSQGVAEWISGPDINGNRIPFGKGQMFSPVRADCVFESGLAFHLYGKLAGSQRHLRAGDNMLLTVMDYQRLERGDSQYGLWYTRGRSGPPWEDDIGWCTIGCFAGHAYAGNPMFRDRGIISAEASVRAAAQTGKGGLTPAGAQDDHQPHPHDRGHLIASWLYTYGATGDRHYLELAIPALRQMAERFPKIARFLISRTAEASRFLLPLALAYAYTGEAIFADTMKQQAAYLRSRMAECGAIQEDRSNTGDRLSGTDLGLTYDANETITDQLYTTSFGAMNLWIAYKVTGDRSYLDLFHRVTDYLVRIQVESEKPEIDGGWMRGFDYSLWEYYGSNADQSWTAYTLETGWTNAIIDIALALYLTDDPFYPARPPQRLAG